MVFAIPPHELIDMLDVSLPKILLGSKKTNPSAWRTLNNLKNGQTKRPLRKSFNHLRKSYPPDSPNPISARIFDIANRTLDLPHQRPWRLAVQSFNDGIKESDGQALVTFSSEAVRLEQIAESVQELALQGSLKAAREKIEQWELAELPIVQSILSQINSRQSAEEFSTTAAPLLIVTTLYLLACWSVDADDSKLLVEKFSIIPELRGGNVIRPMRLWLEGLKRNFNVRTNNELADCLLCARTPSDDPETHRRLFRKWWQEGELVPWQRVPHIVSSLCAVHGEENKEKIESEIYPSLAQIRLLDGLLFYSRAIKERQLPNYDYLAPFRDYPEIRRCAEAKRRSLSPDHGR